MGNTHSGISHDPLDSTANVTTQSIVNATPIEAEKVWGFCF